MINFVIELFFVEFGFGGFGGNENIFVNLILFFFSDIGRLDLIWRILIFWFFLLILLDCFGIIGRDRDK